MAILLLGGWNVNKNDAMTFSKLMEGIFLVTSASNLNGQQHKEIIKLTALGGLICKIEAPT
jgi:hypothetical protein